MAEDNKTEQPTPKKLRDARKKGQVANSRDVTSTALLIALFSYIQVSYQKDMRLIMDLMIFPARLYKLSFGDAYPMMLGLTLHTLGTIIFPYLLICVVVGVAANFFQVGPLLAFEAIKPDFKKLNPVDKLKQMFSKKNIVELIKSTLKILFLGILLYYVIRDLIDPMLKVPNAGFLAFICLIPPVMKTFSMNVMFAYLIVAAFDLFFQRRNHVSQLKMSKDEVKREYKEMEGDPQIKGKRKQLHRELAQGGGGAAQRTKKSSVLVTNPTHYAVALYYDGVTALLPFVTAKGSGALALSMIEAAKEAQVPIMQNPPLARTLYDYADLDMYIPSDLIEPVAEVLRWVHNLKENEATV